MPQFRTLVVDDIAASAKILSILFTKLGQQQVELATSGREAIAKSQELLPEIIVLDLTLGDMSGLTVARTLRQLPEFEQTVIVALSGNNSAEDQQKTQEAGFDFHLGKPISVDEVRQIIAFCEQRHAEGSAGESTN